jgi:hypothetical protein
MPFSFRHVSTVRQSSARSCGLALVVLASGLAHAGVTEVPAGALRINGTWANSSIAVSGTGLLGGNGSILGPVTLASGGTIALGRDAAVGELDVNALTWQAGGAIQFRLGANDALSDRLAFTGALTRQGAGPFEFRFDDGAAPPTAGMTYTLITFASQSGFSPADFSYVYGGSAETLIGEFQLDQDALRFTVLSTPVELQSFDVD